MSSLGASMKGTQSRSKIRLPIVASLVKSNSTRSLIRESISQTDPMKRTSSRYNLRLQRAQPRPWPKVVLVRMEIATLPVRTMSHRPANNCSLLLLIRLLHLVLRNSLVNSSAQISTSCTLRRCSEPSPRIAYLSTGIRS